MKKIEKNRVTRGLNSLPSDCYQASIHSPVESNLIGILLPTLNHTYLK